MSIDGEDRGAVKIDAVGVRVLLGPLGRHRVGGEGVHCTSSHAEGKRYGKLRQAHGSGK